MMICSYFSAYSTLLNIITLHGTILTILHRGENMALIKCPECGNVVSDKALSCPKCGFPVANFQNKSTVPNTAPPLPNKATSTYDSTDNIYLDCGKGHYIKIENGILSISVPLKPLTQDMLENFTLEYYGVSLGLNVGFYIVNINKHYYSGVVDVIVKKRTLVEFNRFMSIMEKHGLFAKRSRVSVLYKTQTPKTPLMNRLCHPRYAKQPTIMRHHSMGYIGLDHWGIIKKYTVHYVKVQTAHGILRRRLLLLKSKLSIGPV